MAKKKIAPPFEILVVVVDKGNGEKVVELLNSNNLTHILQLNGKGTNNEVADLFGFGICERDVIVSFVEEPRSKAIVELIYTDLQLNLEHSGFVFTLQPNCSTLSLLKTLNIEV